jgi:hypothetical protein
MEATNSRIRVEIPGSVATANIYFALLAQRGGYTALQA